MSEENKSKQNSLKFSFDKAKLKVIGGVITAVIVIIGGVALAVNVLQGNNFKAKSGPEEINLLIQSGINSFIDSIDFDELNVNTPAEAINLENLKKEFEDLGGRLKYLKAPDNFDKLVRGKVVHNVFEFDLSVSQETSSYMDFAIDLFSSYPDDYESGEDNNLILSLMQGSEISTDDFNGMKYMIVITSEIRQDEEEILFDLNILMDGEDTFVRINEVSPNGLADEQQDLIGEYIRYDTDRVLSSLRSELYPISETGVGLTGETTDYEEMVNQPLSELFSSIGSTEIALIKSNGPKVVQVIKDNLTELNFFTDIRETNPIRDSEDIQCYTGNFDTRGIVGTIEDILLQSFEQFSSGLPLMAGFDLMDDSGLDELSQLFSLQITTCNNTGDIFNRGFGARFSSPEVLFNGQFITLTYDSDQSMENPETFVESTDAGIPIEAIFGTLQPTGQEEIHAGEEVTLTPEVENLIDRYLSGEITFDEYIDELENLQ